MGSLAGVILAPRIIQFLGGAGFGQSVLVLRILMLGLVLYYLSQPFAWLLVTLNHQSKLPVIYLIGAVFNVTANYFLIPKYSFLASSVITHASEFLILFMLVYAALKAWKNNYAEN
jgi:O-antigen/teichoic acid export membrane protein